MSKHTKYISIMSVVSFGWKIISDGLKKILEFFFFDVIIITYYI